MKILVIQLKRIGDAVVSLPVCSSLRRTFPGARIDYMLYDHVAPLFHDHPDVDNVIIVTREERRRPLRYLRKIMAIRRTRYDIVLDLKTLPASALTTYLSGAAVRIGFDRPRSRAWAYAKTVPRHVAGLNTLERRLQLVRALDTAVRIETDFHISLDEEELERMRRRMRAAGIDWQRPVLLFDITSSRGYKTWPLDYFVSLMATCLDRYRAQIVLSWGPGEKDYVEHAARQLGDRDDVHTEIQTQDVRELATLARHCDLLVGNDSAPRHIAEAVGTPTLAIFSPRTAKQQWMPTLDERHQGVDLGDALGAADAGWREEITDVAANLEHYYRMITPEIVIARLERMLPPLLQSKSSAVDGDAGVTRAVP